MAKKAKAAALLDAEAIIKAAIGQSDQIITLEDDEGAAALGDLSSVLTQADRKLATKLAYLAKAGKGRTASYADAAAYQAQIQSTIVAVKEKVSGIAQRMGTSAIGKSVANSAKIVAKLETAYGVAATPPSLLAAMQASHVQHGPKALLVTRVATSMDRYGEHMGKQFGKIIQVGLASGATVDQMVASLVKHGGPKGTVSLAARETAPGVVQRIRQGKFPDGLFKANKYWAERIVVTECAYAYNGAALASLQSLKMAGEPVQKKILAVFDSRTAPDSIAVHGQIRELDQPFQDGAGRLYQHPPARPNDRETVIAWFDDWPSPPVAQEPTESEKLDAIELANPKPSFPGFSSQDLADLKAQGEHADKAAAARELEEQTRATERLKLLQIEQSAKVAGLRAKGVQAAEEAKKREEAKKQKTLAAQHKKIAKAFKAPKAPATPEMGTLALWELAGSKPEAFADYYLHQTKETISKKTILAVFAQPGEGLKVAAGAHELKKTMVKELAGKHGWPTWSLEGHLATPQGKALVSSMQGFTDAKSVKTKAALMHANATPWKNAQISAKKEGPAWKKFHAAYGELSTPQAPTSAPIPVPPPSKPTAWMLKTGGSGYVDVHDPVTGKKVAYFQTSGANFVVKPPTKLGGGWNERTFSTQELAAEYAAKVGEAIGKLPPTPPAYAAPKTSPFNHVAAQPATRIHALDLEREAAAEHRALRKRAALQYDEHGMPIRRTGNARNAVDQALEREKLADVQNRWSGEYGGCWYGSSDGPKAYAGKFIASDKPDMKDAVDMASQIGHNDPDSMIAYARAKYAATQEALARRLKAGDKIAGHVDEDGFVELYRGVKGKQAEKLRQAREQGETTIVGLRSVSSWSTQRHTAVNFSGGDGVVLRARVHVSRIFSQYEQEEIAMRRFGDGEAEWIVIADKEHVIMNSKDVQNPRDE